MLGVEEQVVGVHAKLPATEITVESASENMGYIIIIGPGSSE